MTRKLAALAMALALLLTLAAAVSASENPDPNLSGSITFLLDWDGTPLEGGSLSLCQVGMLGLIDGKYHFVLIPQLEGSDLSLKDPSDPDLAAAFAALAREKNLPSVTAPISGGKAVFTDLVPGVYLVTQETATEGFAPLNCFLISFPRWEDGRYVYDLTVEPKVGLETEPTEPTETQPTQPPDPSLPQTGQLNWPVPLLSVLGAALFILGWYLCYGKRMHHES